MLDFNVIKTAVATRFAELTKGNKVLFAANVSGDELWDTYLGAFADGEDPIFRERTTHDCSCCRHFIKNIGALVAVDDVGHVESIWDIDAGEYQHIVDALAKLVHSRPVVNRWLSIDKRLGVDHNTGEVDGHVVKFTHFFVNVPAKFLTNDYNAALGEFAQSVNVFKRALSELKLSDVDEVLYLINNNLLARGAEHKNTLTQFRAALVAFNTIPDVDRDAAVFRLTANSAPAVVHVRNSVIGSLLIDLAAGVDVNDAVGSFERKVAGDAYKRPQAIYTEKMKASAAKRVEELGLTSALTRRLARREDVSAANVLFIDGSAQPMPAGDSPFDVISNSTKPLKASKTSAKVRRVSLDEFVSNVLPNATGLEVLFENKHKPNLMSLVAPVDPTAGQLFAWGNNFSWAYTGNNADSVIKQRVKAAGGNVDADVCFRLAWFNTDDLDLHMSEPDGNHIYFGNNRSLRNQSACGGCLDVDMNVHGETRTPVENIFYVDRTHMKSGVYKLYVNNYSRRENVDVGFDVEVQIGGDVELISYRKPVVGGKNVAVLELKYDARTKTFEKIKSLNSTQVKSDVWGVTTGSWCPVELVTKSPNFWEEPGVGNEHLFFILKNCAAPEPVRGFFNEYLRPELREDRRVFEALGAKLLADVDPNGLAGLGFARAGGGELQVKVHGKVDHMIVVEF